jgi:hypothetical protein
MDEQQRLTESYEAFFAAAKKAGQEANKPENLFRRMFGGGVCPAVETLNTSFYQEIERLTAEFAAGQPDSAAARGFCETVIGRAAEGQEDPVAKWILVAVQGLLVPLAGRLSPEDAAAVRQRIVQQYPPRLRVPVQEQLLRALAAAEKA